MNNSATHRSSCIRCGTCCKKGGPALHIEDRQIILDGHISIEHLITIRKGELAFTPEGEKLKPVQQEFVKVAGKGRGWECFFYDGEESSCTIYSHRPLECRVLKCWDTRGLLSITGKDLLSRSDILKPGDPFLKLIEDHEKRCSITEIEKLLASLSEENDGAPSLKRMAKIVQDDLSIRSNALAEFTLPLAVELFLLGRPLFKILGNRGISVQKIMTGR